MARRKLLAGNWKMNGDVTASGEIEAIRDAPPVDADLLICPPYPLVPLMTMMTRDTALNIGAQDCHPAQNGAHTGDVSAELLASLGASHVIVGHSERRSDHGETDATVKAKAEAGLRAGLAPIVCVGETEAERDAGQAEAVVIGQLKGSLPDDLASVIVAYEPVWAIGTGRVPSNDDVVAMHSAIRKMLDARGGQDVRVLYGGSVKPGNAAELLHLDGVDGALIGGASLKAKDFLGIVAAA